MNFKELTELIKLVDKSDLAEVNIKTEDMEVKIRHQKYYKAMTQASHTVVHAAPAASPPAAIHVPAPLVTPTPAKEEVPQAAPVESNPKLIEIKSPMVGTFYRSSSPDKPAFASVGDTVSAGQAVCIIEAMKLFNEIESEVSGKIVKVMVDNATPVEYDQVLFLVEP